MMENVRCNLCGANDYSIVYEKIPDKEDVEITAKYSAAKGVLCTDQVVKCNKCGLVYINPRLEENSIINAVSDGDDESYISQREGRIETFKRGIELVEKHSLKGKILDVGCAAGFFLTAAKERGWEVYGVEPNTFLCEYGLKEFGLNVFNGTLKDAGFSDNYFDVITMWDVLEHTTNPLSELYEANRILKKGGLLVINFPNFSSIWAKIFRRKWWFFLSHHLYYFTPKTLKLMLEKAGFEVIAQSPHVQKLKLGYMIDMIDRLSKDPLSQSVYKISNYFINVTHIENLQVSYSLSQRNIISRKK